MTLQVRNTSQRWGAVAQSFHWLIVALVLSQYLLANIAEGLPAGVGKLGTLAHHKSVGLTILGLAVLRLAWRLANRDSPALPADLKPYERILARVSHDGLYLLLFALPLSGWMMSSAKNYPVSWFGIGPSLPDLVRPNERLFDLLHAVHDTLATALLVIAALHVLAALQHHFVRRDDVLRRMLPFTAPGTRHGAAKLALTAALAVCVGYAAFRTLQPPQAPSKPPAAAAAKGSPDAVSAASSVADGAYTAPPGAAERWVAQTQGSTLDFNFVQAGAPTSGAFGAFIARIDFSPRPRPTGHFDVKIDVASADTHDKERNEQLRMPDLFDVAEHPQATYVADHFAVQGQGFEAYGKLTLRGVTRDVPLTFTFEPGTGTERTATLKGSARLKRLEFGVGQGEWKSTEWISDEVQVNFALQLAPRTAD